MIRTPRTNECFRPNLGDRIDRISITTNLEGGSLENYNYYPRSFLSRLRLSNMSLLVSFFRLYDTTNERASCSFCHHPRPKIRSVQLPTSSSNSKNCRSPIGGHHALRLFYVLLPAQCWADHGSKKRPRSRAVWCRASVPHATS